MKNTIMIAALSMLSFGLQAQDFKNLRYDEDYSHLRDSSSLTPYEKLKYQPIGRTKSFVSVGGEVRYQFFQFKNEDWGDAAEDKNGYLLNRMLLHGDLHINNRLRLFAQLQSSIVVSRAETPSPVELNELEIHQSFIDYTLLQSQSSSVILRAGRQELNYGSSRLVSTREGPNNRQSFDGGKIMMKKDNFKADVFYTEYVAARRGMFNDNFYKDNVQFSGVYLSGTKLPGIRNADLYYLVQKRKKATWNDVTGEEVRHSVGTRMWANHPRWKYDMEGVVQFGNMANYSILAWTLSSNVSYILTSKKNAPYVGLKTELISGDKKAGDNKLESFNPLYPRGAYFGYAALIGPSNLFDIHPSFDLPIKGVAEFSLDYDIFWRYSANDGIYNPGTGVIYTAGESKDKFIGHQMSASFDYFPNRFFIFRLESTWFATGPYLKSVGSGKDILYLGVTTTVKF